MGILDFLNKPLPTGAAAAPQPWGSRVGLFGAALKDVGASLGGNPQDAQNVAMFQQGQRQQTATAATNTAKAALQAALATGDTAKIRQAALGYAAAGGDLSGFATAMKFGQPTVEHVGDNLVSLPTDGSGTANVLYRGERPAPPGYTARPDGSLAFIKGGPADPATIGTAAGIRRQATVDRPMPGKPKPTVFNPSAPRVGPF